MFVLVLFFINIPVALLSLKKQSAVKSLENPLTAINGEGWGNYSRATDSLPDVYYIILDGYAGAKTLRDFYGETGFGLDQYLKQKGFYVADSSRSNYPFTAVSLSSSLNLGYLDPVLDKTTTSELIYDNFVNRAFKKAGYRIVNIESGFAVTENLSLVDKTISTKALNEFENRLLELTILRLDDILGFSHYLRLNNELGQLKKFLPEKGPKFSFIHVVSPHPPYVVDSLGKMTFRTSLSDMAWEPRANYLQQLKFVSNRIEGFVDLALKSKKAPIIIIQSDHGPWIQDTVAQHVYDARTRILNAYYVPDSIKKVLYPTITPVNSFRVIFSELFKAHYPLLPDKPFPYSELRKDVTFRKYNQ